MTTTYFPTKGRLFYFWKGRVALYAILKALGIGPGDEVIMPGFTCVVVPNAVLYLDARPVYADIEPDTYNLSASTVEPLINERTRAIIAQNTFGLSPDLNPILSLAEQHNLLVIEDCAHGLGGAYRGKPNGTVAHATFFSTQWSKPISTGLGGIAYTGDTTLVECLEEIVAKMPPPSSVQQVVLAAQLLVRPLADYPIFYYPLVSIYRFLTQRLGLSVGSSVGNELETTTMPADYTRQMGPLQQQRWQAGLARLSYKVKQRQAAATRYDDFFRSIDLAPPCRPEYADHAMLRYAVRVPDKEKLLQKARQNRIPVGDWFVSPLHPVTGNLSQWGYHTGRCPVAERACREVINLFTDSPLSESQLAVLFEN